jgi:hypothetical protein
VSAHAASRAVVPACQDERSQVTIARDGPCGSFGLACARRFSGSGLRESFCHLGGLTIQRLPHRVSLMGVCRNSKRPTVESTRVTTTSSPPKPKTKHVSTRARSDT